MTDAICNLTQGRLCRPIGAAYQQNATRKNRRSMNPRSLAATALLLLVTSGAMAADRGRPSRPEPFRRDAVLKDYAGDTLIATSIHGHGNNGLLTGGNVELNRAKTLEHMNCAQAVVFAAWPHAGGVWPAEKPASLDDYVFETATLDGLIEWARSNDLPVAHHLLLGPNFYMPEWFATAGYTAEELDSVLSLYFETALTSNDNGRKVRSWNLVNEVLETDNSGAYRKAGDGQWDSQWMAMGHEPDRSGLTGDAKVNDRHPVFIRRAFEHAARHASGKLEIRDYKIEFTTAPVTEDGVTRVEPNRKAAAFYQLVKHMVNSGVPIGAVGFQMHLCYGSDHHYREYDFDDLAENIRRYKELGLEVYVSELDVGLHWDEADEVDGVRQPNDKADFEELAAQQPTTYYRAVRAAREGGADMISTWGLIDGTMENWRKGERALLLDERGERKRAYQAVLRALYETLPEQR